MISNWPWERDDHDDMTGYEINLIDSKIETQIVD